MGRVAAQGRSCKQLATEIKAPLEKEYFYKATVIISLDTASAKSRGRVYITGQVRYQGPMELPIDEIFTDQQRLRQNIQSLNNVSGQQTQVQTYAAQLTKQETEIARLRDVKAAAERRKVTAQGELDALIEKADF